MAVDLLTAPALAGLLTRLLGDVAGEAGKQTWAALARLVRRVFHRDAQPVTALEAVEERPEDGARTRTLAEVLVGEAERNPRFARQLREWCAEAEHAVSVSGAHNVANVISGQAQVHGPVVQARDVSGPITFGQPGPQ